MVNTDSYINKHCIPADATIIEALERLNSLSGDVLTLFVCDERNRVLGSLTDGDIRRALIKRISIYDYVHTIMNRNFIFVHDKAPDIVKAIANARQSKIKLLPQLNQDKILVKLIDLENHLSMLPIDAVIMAGGKGVRLKPLTDSTPKPLLKVGGKAIIDHNVDRLISFGIDNIYVTVNYLKEQIIDHYSAPRNGVEIKCVEEPCFLGTIGAVKLISEFKNDTVLVMNSDLFTNINYEEFYRHFREHNADMSVCAVPYTVSLPYGIMDLEGRNITGLLEKPTYNYYINAGIYLIKREMLDYIPNNTFYNSTDLIFNLISLNKKVIRFSMNGTWIDIGSHQEYNKVKDLVEYR